MMTSHYAKCLSAAASCFLLCGLARADDTGGKPLPGSARSLLARWVETQQIISKERQEWQEGKQILTSRIDLIKNELEALRSKTREIGEEKSEPAGKKTDLLAQQETLKTASVRLEAAAARMESQVRRLLGQLPDPVKAKVGPLSARIPADPTNTSISVAERFQNIIGILNEVNKAISEITVTSEVHTLNNGSPAEVRVVYVGLGQAYFVSAGGEAGIGVPSAEGWQWKTANEVAPQIVAAIEVLQSKAAPKFIALPVRIQ